MVPSEDKRQHYFNNNC